MPNRKSEPVLRAGDVMAMPLPLGGYGACQVTFVDRASVEACGLAWWSESPPTAEEAVAAGPLRLDHHAHDGSLAHSVMDSSAPPPDFVRLGRLPLHRDIPEHSQAWSSWEQLPLQVGMQRRWDSELPTSAKRAYKDAGAHPAAPTLVDLGGGATRLPMGTGHLDLVSEIAVPPSGPVRWAALDALPHLTGLRWSGAERGLLAALAARPMIHSLHWQDPPAVIDLRATRLTDVSFHGEPPTRLHLPGGLMDLRLSGPIETPPRVEAADQGRWIRLTLESPQPAVPPGLSNVAKLELIVRGEASLSSLRELANLRSLRIEWTGPPGRLIDPEILTTFEHLHTLELLDAYALDAAAWPDPDAWPALRRLVIDGVRKSDADTLRPRYRRSRVAVSVRGAKSDTWLAANLTNPFRDWVDDDRRAGTAACKAYAEALRAIDHAHADDHDRAAVRSSLRTLVDKLNTIDERHGIDTLRREEASDAFGELAERAGVPRDQAADWFDEWREF